MKSARNIPSIVAIFVILTVLTLTPMITQATNGSIAKIAVDPPEIVDPTLVPPKTFEVNVTIDDVEGLYGYGFNLTFNLDVLVCLQAYPHDVLGETNYFPEIYISNLKGFVWVNVTYYSPAVPVTTNDPLTFVTIKFGMKNLGSSVLNLTDTSMTDFTGTPIPHEASDGFVMSLIVDVAITNVVTSRTWAYAGWPVNVTVTVENLGDAAFLGIYCGVRAYANNSLIGSGLVGPVFLPGEAVDLIFTWDTTGLPEGHYDIRAEADIMDPYEINTANNEFTDSSVAIVTVLKDIAITNVVPSAYLPYEEWLVDITVTVKNQGETNENFEVKAYYDDNLIGTVPLSLASLEEINLHFTWDIATAELYRNYTIRAEATLLPLEYNETNNSFIDGVVQARLMGDINNDRTVDIVDVSFVAYAFGSYPGHPRWDEEADLNLDGFVDIQDVGSVAFNFGRTY